MGGSCIAGACNCGCCNRAAVSAEIPKIATCCAESFGQARRRSCESTLFSYSIKYLLQKCRLTGRQEIAAACPKVVRLLLAPTSFMPQHRKPAQQHSPAVASCNLPSANPIVPSASRPCIPYGAHLVWSHLATPIPHQRPSLSRMATDDGLRAAGWPSHSHTHNDPVSKAECKQI